MLVSFHQLATIIGIILLFWIGYGSNYIGGIGETQSNLAWRLPSIIQVRARMSSVWSRTDCVFTQGIPAVILAVAIFVSPFSPRWLVKQGRIGGALAMLSYSRNLPSDNELVQIEYLEIKAEALAEERAFAKTYPRLAGREKRNVWLEQIAQYANCFRTMDNFKRISTAFLVMFFQQQVKSL